MSSHPIPQCSTLRNQFHPQNQVHPIPGTRSSFNIRDLLVINRVPSISGIPGTECRRNYSEFQEVPGIPSDSAQFRFDSIPGIPYWNWLCLGETNLQSQQYAWGWERVLIPVRNPGIGWYWFWGGTGSRNVQHRGIGSILIGPQQF